MNDASVADVSYAEIGTLFRSAREERRLSLDHAARELHIRVRYLEALEEGKFAELPGNAYIKGYLQRYAVYLQMDKEEVLRRYEQMEGVLARKGFYFPQVFSREQKPSYNMTYGSLAAAVLVYILWATFFAPEHTDIAIVDSIQKAAPAIPTHAAIPAGVACFQSQDRLYPPCYENRGDALLLLPPKRPLDTVMQLATYTR